MRYHFFRNFDDYPGFKPKITPPPKHFSRQCSSPVPPALITQDFYDHFMPCAYTVILTAKPDDSSVTRNQIRVLAFNVPQFKHKLHFYLQKIKYCKMFFLISVTLETVVTKIMKFGHSKTIFYFQKCH